MIRRGAKPVRRGRRNSQQWPPVINVNETIDRQPITTYQIGILDLCMLVALLDGFDTQAIGYTAPAIAQALHLPREVLGAVFSAGLFGAMLGALSFGPLADRLGRKRFMVAATIMLSVFSLLTAHVTTLQRAARLPLSSRGSASAARCRAFWRSAASSPRCASAACS